MSVARKVTSFLKDPLGSLGWRAHRAADRVVAAFEARMRTLLRWWSRTSLERKGLLDLLANRPANAYPPDHADLWFLYRQVRKRKPRCILEFGAGCSTVILAQALYENTRESPGAAGHLYSVDAIPYWAETTSRLLPPHLRQICSITTSELVKAEHAGVPVLRHASVPDVAPDFLYVDGPDFTEKNRRAIVDPVDIEHRWRTGFCMVIDGRTANTRFLQENLKGRYIVRHHWPLEDWKTTVFEMVC